MINLTEKDIKNIREELAEHPEALAELQKAVDEMRKTDLADYVEQRKLHMLDSKYQPIDLLLELEIIK